VGDVPAFSRRPISEALETYLSLADAREALASGEASFPLVVKPRWGSASIGIEYSEDDQELELGYALAKKRLPRTSLSDFDAADPERCIVIQKRLAGQEFGLDVVNDLDGRYQCTFVRRKLAMRAGETDQRPHREERTAGSDRRGHRAAASPRRILDCDAIVYGRRLLRDRHESCFGGGCSPTSRGQICPRCWSHGPIGNRLTPDG
jgi:carbamoyl-phosphate synthase large subunit